MATAGSSHRLGIASAALGVLAAAALPAAADPAAGGAPVVPPAATRSPARARPASSGSELTAADVAGSPAPGGESGRIDRGDGGDSAVRRALRALLFVPRIVVDVVLSPVRAAMFAYDRYHLKDWYYRVFYNDARTIGVIPSAWYETGFGFTAGARFVHLDLFGAGERLSIGAQGGGRYHEVVRASLDSGDRLGDHLHIALAGQYEKRPKDVFYGIGNHDESARPPAPVDPTVRPIAVETRYRERLERVAAVIDVRPIGNLHLRSSSELTDRDFSPSKFGLSIERVYDPAALVGYDGVRQLYSELELRYDDRRRAILYEPMPFHSRGSLAAVFGGRVHRLDDGADYWRYGIDLQHFLRLAEGPRVLAIRLHGEAVSGPVSEVPFTDLPRLGGPIRLRGYPTDRFRDRIAALGSIEYAWDLSKQIAASLFVDAGRVLRAFDDPGGGPLRAGYGVALQGHTEYHFGFRGTLASSIDGGVFLYLSFTPVFALDERVRRR